MTPTDKPSPAAKPGRKGKTMNKRLLPCQFNGFIGINRYAYRAFHNKILSCTNFMLYVSISHSDGWCGITDDKLKGFLDAEEIHAYAEREVKRIEAL